MSCAECERADQGRRMARVKRWAGVIFVVGVVAFVAWEELSRSRAQLPAAPAGVHRP